MSLTTARPKSNSRQRVHLSGVDWQTYTRLLRAFGEKSHVRLTYDRGELEIMSPLLEHDSPGWVLGWLVLLLTQEFGLPIFPGGSVTMRRRKHMRGIEADACFWIANAHLMAGHRKLDLRVDPPPDLALEVDVTHGSLDRLGIYAALRVPEVWRLEGDLLTFHVLGTDGNYTIAATSRSFPLVTPSELVRFLKAAAEAGDFNVIDGRFREWIRQRKLTQQQPENPA